MRKKLVLGALLFCSWNGAAETINAVCPEKTVPFCYPHDGKNIGLVVDVYQEIGRRLGKEVAVHPAPFKRMLQYLQSGKYNLAGPFNYSDARAQYAHYLHQPIFTMRFIVYGYKDSYFPVNSIVDIYGKKVGVRRGFHITDAYTKAVAENRLDVALANSDEQLLAMLIKGRVQFIVTPQYTVLGNSDRLSDQFVEYGELPTKRNTHLMISVRKGSSLDKIYYEKLNQALIEMKKDGTLERISKKYKVWVDH